MNIFVSIINFLYRIRWWLIIGCTSTMLLVYLLTVEMKKAYEVNTTIYTGIVSGYDIQSTTENASTVNQTSVNNAMDNLLNILVSKATLNRVALRLFTQHMMYGDPNEDNNYIKANNFRDLYSVVPQEVRDLIDKSSEEITLKNLYEYQERSYDNYVYGLFNWDHPFYSYQALKNIMVRRVGGSDMIEISYQASDPGVAYNTLIILSDEFTKQYSALRYGETDSVIKYFEEELGKARKNLTAAEDSLTIYSVDKRVINYEEQSKHVAALSRDFELSYEAILLKFEGTKKQIEMLGSRIGEYEKRAKSSKEFLSSSENINNLNTQITQLEIFGDKSPREMAKLKVLKDEMANEEKRFMDFAKMFGESKYTAEGISNLSFIEQWLQATVDHEKAAAELDVMKKRRLELDDKYTFFSPVGTTIKRKEREISFTEESYQNVLHALNLAKLRKKNLQLTGASLQVINPPIFPLLSKPTKRKYIVLGSGIAAFFFIMGLFLMIELIDRTLRDKRRAESITKLNVLGALPAPQRAKYRVFNKQCEEIAEKYLSNVLLNFEKISGHIILNVCSMEENGEKEKIAQNLYRQWQQAELNVKIAICGEDFFVESKEYMFAKNVESIIGFDEYDVVIIVLPALSKSSVPQGLLAGASVNLILAQANGIWQEADQLLVDNLVERAGKTPVKLCLTLADRAAVETFTGLLPPYTPLRKFIYKILQLGITSK